MAIKRPDLSLPLISDLSLGAKGSVFKGSLSPVSATVSHGLPSSSIHPSIFSPLFQTFLHLYFSFLYRLTAVGSSSPAANQVASSLSSWIPFLSCQKVMAGPDLFLQWLLHQLWLATPQSPFSLCFLSTLPFYFVTHLYFSFPIQVSSLSSQNPVVSSPLSLVYAAMWL